MGKILVTGGAGYVGSHIVRILVEAGEEVTVVDNLSQGHREAVAGVRLIEADFDDERMLAAELGGVETVVHMAALCEVGESMQRPAEYYRTNLQAGLTLLEAARRSGVRGFVFSSSAAVYGEPETVPVTETHPQNPTNPYGATKLAFERALGWYPDGSIGEDHSPESHLVPRLIRATIDGADPMPVFGEDYDTPDGTCIRDYVHVVDLARAHVLALRATRDESGRGRVFNLGNGSGFSVRQMIDTVERVTVRRPATYAAPRRAGDPARRVASSERIREELGWSPEFPLPDRIVSTAWNWHREHPRGYAGSG